MKKLLCCMGALLLTLSVFGKYTGKAWLYKNNEGIYKVGDTVTCKVKLSKDGRALKGTQARVTIKFEGKAVKTQKFTTTGRPVTFTYQAGKPGWVYFGFEILDEDGNVLKGKDVYRYPTKQTIVTEVGAMIEPEKLTAIPRPADFEAFWAARRAALDKVPIEPTVKPLKIEMAEIKKRKIRGISREDLDKIKVYEVIIPAIGEHPVQAYLAIPANAKPKSCCVYVDWASWSASDSNLGAALLHAKKGDIGFSPTWHGRPIHMGAEWYNYKTTITGIDGGMVGIEDRDTWCFGFMYYRLMRALDYVKTLPEWDGKNLISVGGSLGGAQSTAAAALDKDVTLAVITNPCFCDFDGDASGRTGSIPRGVHRKGAKSPKALAAQSYYDCINFAPMIKCPVFISTGGTDELCPPSNVFVVFNSLPAETKAKSQMFFNPAAGHYGQINRSAAPHIKKLLDSVVINRYDEKN